MRTVNKEGFTLIEVVIAMAVLSIGLLGAAAMQITSIHSNFKASNLTEATTHGLTQMETILSWPYDDARIINPNNINYNRIGDLIIAPGNIMITTIADTADSSTQVDKYTIYWDATPDFPAVDSMSVRVDVVWNEETLLKTVSMNFVKTRF